MTSLGETAYVGTLHYDALVPPVSGGGGVDNPMTADLDANGFNINNAGNLITNPLQSNLDGDATNSIVNIESVGGATLVDTEPADTETLYKEQIVTGTGWLQSGAGQDEFNPATTNFPQSVPLWWANKEPINAIAGIIGRRTGVTLPPGTIGNQVGFGTKSLFRDQIIYDPLNMRYAPTAPNSFTAVRFGDNLRGYNGSGNQMSCMIYVHVHLEGAWGGSNSNNDLKLFVRHFDSAGVLRRDYQVLRIAGKATADIVESGDRLLMGFAPYGEDVNGDDYMEIWMEVDAGSPNSFTISLLKGLIEYRPCP